MTIKPAGNRCLHVTSHNRFFPAVTSLSLWLLIALVGVLVPMATGCGGGSENRSVLEDASEAQLAAYNAKIQKKREREKSEAEDD